MQKLATETVLKQAELIANELTKEEQLVDLEGCFFGGIKGTDNNCISPTAPQRLFQKKKRTGDLEKYISKRKNKSADFAKSFEVGYETFRFGFILRQAREELGITQEEVTRKLHAKKSAISHIENHAEDIRLSTLSQYAKALSRSLHVVMR